MHRKTDWSKVNEATVEDMRRFAGWDKTEPGTRTVSEINRLIRELHGREFLIEGDDEAGVSVYVPCVDEANPSHTHDIYRHVAFSRCDLLAALIKRGIEL